MIQKRWTLGLVLVSVGSIGLIMLVLFQPRVYSMDNAFNISERYLTSLNRPDLAIGEIMEFEQNFYVVYYEKSTGIGAFEMLIDKGTGRISPEYGPNMMWNTKYGHGGMMGGWSQIPSGQMSLDHDKATLLAQEFLDQSYPGTIAADTHVFYGYYTVTLQKTERYMECSASTATTGRSGITTGMARTFRVERFMKNEKTLHRDILCTFRQII